MSSVTRLHRRRSALAMALVVALVSSGIHLGVAVETAAAASPAISATPTSFGSGQTVTIGGSGFDPSVSVDVWFDANGNGTKEADEASTSVVTDSTGNFAGASIDVFGSPGSYQIRASGPGPSNAETTISIGSCWIQDEGCTINGAEYICLVGDAPSEMISDCKAIDSNYSDTTKFPNGWEFSNVGPRFVGAGVLAAAAVSVNPVPLSGCVAMTNAIIVAKNSPFNNVVPDEFYAFSPTHGLVSTACGVPFLGIPPFDLTLYGAAAAIDAALPGHHGLPDPALDDAIIIAGVVAAIQAAAATAEAVVPGSGVTLLLAAQQSLAAAAVDGAIACGHVNYYCNGSDITGNIIAHADLQQRQLPFMFGGSTRWGDIIGWALPVCHSNVVPPQGEIGECSTPATLPDPGSAGDLNVLADIKCATGPIIGLSIGYDGDLSFDINDNPDPELGPGPAIEALTNYHNFQPGPGGSEPPNGLDIEIPLADRGLFMPTLVKLRINTPVQVCGRWVADMHQSWNELHPVTSLKIVDATPPVITPTITGSLGTNGWYTSDVDVTWSVIDDQSAISTKTGCDPTTINADTSTAGTALTCTATSDGGTSSGSVTIKRDTTKPTISAAGSPAANGAGWNNSDVTVHFTCADVPSGIPALACPADQILSTEGAAVSSTAKTVNDAAGNTSDASNVVTVKIDKTKPTVSVTGVADGAQYVSGAVPTAGCQTTDGLSGVATVASVVVTTTGTNGVGSFTATCDGAIDVAGNPQAAPVTAKYAVVYGFGGFLSPLPRSTLTKSGSTIPVKFRLTNAAGQPITASLAAPLATGGNVTATLSGPGITTVSATCSWSTSDLFFQCNIKTPSGISAGPAYLITAYERLGSTFVIAPAVGSAINPEIASFK